MAIDTRASGVAHKDFLALPVHLRIEQRHVTTFFTRNAFSHKDERSSRLPAGSRNEVPTLLPRAASCPQQSTVQTVTDSNKQQTQVRTNGQKERQTKRKTSKRPSVSLSVGPSIRPSVRPFVCLSVDSLVQLVPRASGQTTTTRTTRNDQ